VQSRAILIFALSNLCSRPRGKLTSARQLHTGAVDESEGTGAILGLGPQTPAGAIHLNVNPPTTGDEFSSDEESDDEDEDRPLTRDELKARTMRRLNKRDTTKNQRKSKRR
jgi:hypothetical protein